MKDWQKRVVAEKEELVERLVKLGRFIGSAGYLELGDREGRRLLDQHHYMQGYNRVLGARIDGFGKEA